MQNGALGILNMVLEGVEEVALHELDYNVLHTGEIVVCLRILAFVSELT